jgi:hypothetical protein
MGKGNRNSQKRIEENVKNSAKILEKQNKANKQKRHYCYDSLHLNIILG